MRELKEGFRRLLVSLAASFAEPAPRAAARPGFERLNPRVLARKALAVSLSAALLVAGWPASFTVAPAFAAVPQLINYQGKLGDASGNPLSGTYSMRFQLFDAPSGGNLLFSETEDSSTSNPIAVANGIYTVTIGGVTAGGIPASVFYGANVYLELSINAGATLSGPETLAPRERLIANGYALHSITAENMGTGVAIATFTSAGNLLVPYGVVASSAAFSGSLTASSATLTAAGNTQFSVAASSGINVTGGGVYAPFFSGVYYGDGSHLSGVTATGVSAPNVSAGQFGANVGGGNFSFPANVGIGTTSPASKLHVSSGTVYVDGGVAGLSVGVSTFVVTAGRVGIGTASPNNTLQIPGLVNFDNPKFATSLGFQAGNVNTGSSGFFLGYQAGVVNAAAANNAAIGSLALSANTGGAQNAAFGATALQNNQSGNGNTAAGFAASLFNVSGSNNVAVGAGAGQGVSGQSYSNNTIVGNGAGAALTIGSNNVLLGDSAGSGLNTGSGNIVIGHNANAVAAGGSNQLDIGNLIFGTNVSGTGAALSPGNVGVGVQNPAARLHVSSGTASLLVDGNASTPFQVGISTLIVTSAGNVGIGTSTPTSPLHVNQGNQTNVASLNLANLGAGTSGILMSVNAGGTLQIGDNTAGPFQIVASNRPIVYTVNNGAFFLGSAAHTLAQGPSTPARVVMSVQASDPAQTGDLQEWQSNGIVLSSVTASGGFVTKYGLNAATATFTATGNTQFDITASSGISVTGTGGVTAPFFSGALYGDGSRLTGVTAGSVNASGVTPGTFQNGVYTFQNTVNFTGALPNIVAGSSITTTGSFFGGSLATGGVQRLDPAGNLVNIGNITGAAGVTLQATGGTLAHSATGANIQTFLTNGAERMRLDANGNLGIGTTSPTGLLHVLGGGFGIISDMPSASNHLTFRVGGANKWFEYVVGNDLRFSDGADRVVIQGGGNIGVGTTAPAARIHMSSGTLLVDGNASLPFQVGVTTFAVTSAANVGIGTSSPANRLVASLGPSQIGQLNDGANASAFWGTNIGFLSQAGQAQISAVPTAPIVFYTGGTLNTMTAGTERMRLDTAGNLGVATASGGARLIVQGAGNTNTTSGLNVVNSATATELFVRDDGWIGVGTNNPQSLLHAVTNVTSTITFQDSTSAAQFGVTLASPDHNWGIDESYAGAPAPVAGSLSLVDQATGKTRIVFDPGGNVGVGSARPAGLLHVSSGTLLLDGNATTPFQVGVSSFVVNSNGNVGIGVASPTQLLQVVAGGTVLAVTPGGNVGFSISSPGNKFVSWETAGQIAQFNDNGSDSSALWGSGVGLLSTGNPPTLAQIATSGVIQMAFSTGGTLNTTTSGTERMRLDLNGNLGIGTTSPTAKLEVNGGIKITAGSGGVFTFQDGSSQSFADGVSRWSVNGGSIYNTNLANVGIGTSSPITVLDVNGIAALGTTGGVYNYQLAGNLGTIAFNTYGAASQAGAAGFGGLWQFSDSTGDMTYYTGTNVGAGVSHVMTPQLVLKNNGTVGIGTTSPDANYRLTVQQSAAALPVMRAQMTQANGWSNLDFTDTAGTNKGGVGWGNAGVANFPNILYFGTVAADTVTIVTNNLSRMNVNPNGNVGIGTTDPTALTHVVNRNQNFLVVEDAGAGAPMAGGAFEGFGLQYTTFGGEGALMASYPGGVGRMTFWTMNGSMGQRMMIDSIGNVGIGTSGPVNDLDLTGALALGSYAGVNTAPAGTSLISSDRIGIGLTSPTHLLGVFGGAAATTLYGRTGTVNTSDTLFLGNGGQDFYIDRPGASGGQLIFGYNSAKILGVNDPLQIYNNSTDHQFLIEVRSRGTGGGNNQVLLLPTGAGNVGIGNNSPIEKLVVNGALGIGDDFAAACDASHRGVTKIVNSANGTGDLYQICMKNNRDTYVWTTISNADYVYPNGAGGFYIYSGSDAQGHASAACTSVYGAGNCTTGVCDYNYYYNTADGQCSCTKAIGTYEFIYSNPSFTTVGGAYGGQTSDTTGNNGFVRRKTSAVCDANSWELTLPNLGNTHPTIESRFPLTGGTFNGSLTVNSGVQATDFRYSPAATKYMVLAGGHCLHNWGAGAGYATVQPFFTYLSDGSTANPCTFSISPPNGATLVGIQMQVFTGVGTTTCKLYEGNTSTSFNAGTLLATVSDPTNASWHLSSEAVFSHVVDDVNSSYAVVCSNGSIGAGNIALGSIRIRYTETEAGP